MLTSYIRAAMRRDRHEIWRDDGTFFGSIPGFQGVWANAPSLEACREELESALQDWILIRVSDHLPLPLAEGAEPMMRADCEASAQVERASGRLKGRSTPNKAPVINWE
jgi:predicted RNase H-like HicB family nuclease